MRTITKNKISKVEKERQGKKMKIKIADRPFIGMEELDTLERYINKGIVVQDDYIIDETIDILEQPTKISDYVQKWICDINILVDHINNAGKYSD